MKKGLGHDSLLARYRAKAATGKMSMPVTLTTMSASCPNSSLLQVDLIDRGVDSIIHCHVPPKAKSMAALNKDDKRGNNPKA